MKRHIGETEIALAQIWQKLLGLKQAAAMTISLNSAAIR